MDAVQRLNGDGGASSLRRSGPPSGLLVSIRYSPTSRKLGLKEDWGPAAAVAPESLQGDYGSACAFGRTYTLYSRIFLFVSLVKLLRKAALPKQPDALYEHQNNQKKLGNSSSNGILLICCS